MLRKQILTKTSEVFRDNRTCGFCHNPFLPGEEVVTCPQCGAVHHADCWQANGNKCTTHLCSGNDIVFTSPHPSVLPSSSSNTILSRNTLIAAIVGGVVVAVLCSIVGFVGMPLLNSANQNLPTLVAPANITSSVSEDPTVAALSSSHQTDTPIPVQIAVPEPTATSTRKSPTPRPATVNPTSSPIFEWNDIGNSVRGRDLSIATAGYEGNTAIVVVGSIQGDQPRTRDLINELVSYYQRDLTRVPDKVAFYFLPSINPDGNASNSRYNAHNVDLNRNWDTSDWKSNAAVPGYPDGMSGAGGSKPFSEPETRVLQDFLLQMQLQSSELIVVILHTSVNRTQGEIYPGGDQAITLARAYANETDYNIEYSWAEYTTSGEAITWCEEQGILALDIVIPASHRPSTSVYGSNTLLDVTIDALESIAD